MSYSELFQRRLRGSILWSSCNVSLLQSKRDYSKLPRPWYLDELMKTDKDTKDNPSQAKK